MLEIKEEFKHRLERALAIRDMKPAELSRATGISEATISQYRSGYSKPKDTRLVQIANCLHVDPVWLMGLDVPMDKESATTSSAASPTFSQEESDIALAYRKASEDTKNAAAAVLGVKRKDTSSISMKNNVE